MKLIIDGQVIDKDDVTGEAGTGISITVLDKDEVKAVSQEYVLTGDAYTLIENALINNVDGKNSFLTVKIYEDKCCDTDILLFEGIIRGDMIDWCYGECSVRVRLMEHTEETKKLDCIKSTLVYDNHNGFIYAQHPRIPYCVEIRPDFLQHVVMIFGIILNIIFFVLTPVVAIVSVIIQVINAIIDALQAVGININNIGGWDGNTNTTLMQEFESFKDRLNELLIGCGRKHPSPFVRSYIQNVCDKCGITFSSTIYNNVNSDYYNAMYLSAPIEKGTRDDNITWIDENHPIKTLDLFLDDLALVHNARWDLINGVLYFERHDFFNDGVVFQSFETLNNSNRIQGSLCLEWRDEQRPSYISLTYSPDAVDVVGNEAANRFNDIVEWNQPFSELQSGSREVQLSFGTPRFRDDGINEDILGIYAFANFGIGATINEYQSVLTLEKGTCFNPKLLIWDGVSMNFARIKKYNIAGFDVPSDENYNFPYMFNEWNASPNTAYPSNQPNTGLYPRFYSIDNPKLIIDKGLTFTFTMYYDCSLLSDALTARYVQLPQGIGRIKKMDVSLQNQTITISGDV